MRTQYSRWPKLLAAVAMFAVVFAISAAGTSSTNVTLELRSPDGRIAVAVNPSGVLTYRVAVDGVPLLNESRLGLRLRDGELGRDVALVKAERNDVDTTWTNPLGKRRQVRDHHRELALTLREQSSGREFQVIFRAFDDGVGFRYALPAWTGAKDFIVEEELTEFAFTADNLCFAGDHTRIPPDEYDVRGGFAGSQEWEFLRQRLSDLSPDTVTGLPLLTQTPAAWAAITEADLIDWAGLWLAREPQAAGTTAVTLRARLAPRLDGQGLVKASLPHASPWRVLIVGREPGRLIESDLVLNLSTPCQIADISWIKPGMMAWDSWWSGVGKKDTATMKQFIQFAGEMGWPYQLVDGGWYVGTHTGAPRPDADITRPSPDVDMPELLRYAGEIRTWPNQITREGILGNEYNKWSRRVTAEHRVTLPFTRFLAGPGDFTPGGFLNRTSAQFQKGVTPTQVQSTRAGHLALFVCYDSPVMCVCDHPDNLRGQPGLDFLKIVPTVWDETRVLSGAVGEHLVMARRSGSNWFLGALNNDYTRVCATKLDFLGEGKWKMRWWHDARDSSEKPEHIEIEERTVTAGETLNLRLSPGGGTVIQFVPER